LLASFSTLLATQVNESWYKHTTASSMAKNLIIPLPCIVNQKCVINSLYSFFKQDGKSNKISQNEFFKSTK